MTADDRSVLDDIRQYETALFDEEEKPRGTLLNKVIGGTLKARSLREFRTKKLPRVEHGGRYGHLTASHYGRKHGRKGTMYQAVCDCGRTAMLTTTELHQRAALNVGCLEDGCKHGPLEARVWLDPKFALWVQLNFLLSNKPEEVDNAWGGRAYEDISMVTADEGQAAFLECVWPAVAANLDDKCWWMHRINPVLPYSPSNIHFNRTPDPDVVRMNLDTVRYGSSLYTLEQLANLFEVPLERVTELRHRMVSDCALMDKLIEEGEA